MLSCKRVHSFHAFFFPFNETFIAFSPPSLIQSWKQAVLCLLRLSFLLFSPSSHSSHKGNNIFVLFWHENKSCTQMLRTIEIDSIHLHGVILYHRFPWHARIPASADLFLSLFPRERCATRDSTKGKEINRKGGLLGLHILHLSSVLPGMRISSSSGDSSSVEICRVSSIFLLLRSTSAEMLIPSFSPRREELIGTHIVFFVSHRHASIVRHSLIAFPECNELKVVGLSQRALISSAHHSVASSTIFIY